jgi:hypothetical protein
MQKIGQPMRLGIWMVKSEKTSEFIKAWQLSADWIAQNLPEDGEAILLQETEDPNKFISFGFSSNLEKVQDVMSQTEYQELFSRVRALCDDVQPHRMNVVGYSSSSNIE